MIYDAVIIGAGPAGAYAGFLLAKANLKVALVDRRHFPRDKLCGGLLTSKTVDLLQPILPIDRISHYDIKTSHIFYQGNLTASFQLLSSAYTIQRFQFDTMLMKAAEELGVHTYLGTSLQSVDFNQKEIYLSCGRKLKYFTLIGADGVLSKTRQLAGLTKNEMGFCVEAHVPWDALKNIDRLHTGGIEIYYGDYPNGYSWIFPCKNSVAVGVGSLAQGLGERDILELYGLFQKETMISEGVKHMGAYLPSGTSVVLGNPQVKDLCLIGDAAGLIDPFTGEGIYYALLSAKILADSIILGVSVYPEYEQRMRQVVNDIRNTVHIRDHIYSPKVLKYSLDFMKGGLQYSEQLIDETILRYEKKYVEAYEDFKYYNR